MDKFVKSKIKFLYIILVLIFIISLIIIKNLITKPYIEICYESNNNGIMQVYYDNGEGFNENRSERNYYSATKNKEYIKFNLEIGSYKNLRIDPIDQGDLDIKIYSIKLIDKNISKSFVDKNLTDLKGFINYSWENEVLVINDKITIDPQIVLNYEKL